MSGLVPVVESVVNDKVQNGELFTAHDVTLEARKRGQRVGHGEVRDAVHDYYGRGGMGVEYTRTTISVPGGTPYLYHRSADDPAAYQNIRGAAPVSQPTSVVSSQPNDDEVPDYEQDEFGESEEDEGDEDEDDFGENTGIGGVLAGVASKLSTATKTPKTKDRPVDARMTLSIPAPLIRDAGFVAGQKVYVISSNQTVLDGPVPAVEIFSSPAKPAVPHGRYTVDRNEQVRITQKRLQSLGLGGDRYDVSQVGNKVVVKLSK